MLIAIDGTGNGDNLTYWAENKGSHVVRIYRESGDAHKAYFRGPILDGGGISKIVQDAKDWIHKSISADSKDLSLTLVGHSRGALAALLLAKELKKVKKKVDSTGLTRPTNSPTPALYGKGSTLVLKPPSTQIKIVSLADVSIRCVGLFDCVDNYLFGDASLVPTNVPICFHAVRDPSVRSRRLFFNDGLRVEDAKATALVLQYFKGTHAALGGTPWTGDHPSVMVPGSTVGGEFKVVPTITESQDRATSAAVYAWMVSKLAAVDAISSNAADRDWNNKITPCTNINKL
jgi:pimeloyl-ACP methyl ester carboxylesterase